MKTVSVILPAAGKSRRFVADRQSPGNVEIPLEEKKLFAPLDGQPVWYRSALRFLCRDDVRQVIVVISPEDRDEFTARYGEIIDANRIELVDGGKERSDSVAAGLARVDESIDLVCVHDAARPLVTQSKIDAVFQAASQSGAALLAVPIVGTVKRAAETEDPADQPTIEKTIDRRRLWEAQTPQVFDRSLLVDAYAQREQLQATDDALLFERLSRPVVLVEGSRWNLKITTREDLETARRLYPLTADE